MATGDFYDPLQCALSLSLVFAPRQETLFLGAAAALRYLYYAIIFYNDN